MHKQKKVLIIDDSSISRLMVKNLLLARHPDWEIAQAGNGEEAIQRALATPPDLITLDLNMPGLDGLETAKRLHEVCPGAKMAIITANIQDTMRKRVQSLGILFIAMIEKPINDAGIEKILFGIAP